MQPRKSIAVALSAALIAANTHQAWAAVAEKAAAAPPIADAQVTLHVPGAPLASSVLALQPLPGIAALASAASATTAAQPAAVESAAAMPAAAELSASLPAIRQIEDQIAATDASPDDLSAAGLDLERRITGQRVKANADIVARAPEFLEGGKHDALAHALSVLAKASPYTPEFRKFLYSSRHRAALDAAAAAGGDIGAKAIALHKQLSNIISPALLRRGAQRLKQGTWIISTIVCWIGAFTIADTLALPAMVLTLASVVLFAQTPEDWTALERYEKHFSFYNKTTAAKTRALAALSTMIRRQRQLDASLRPLIAAQQEAPTDALPIVVQEDRSLKSGVERLLKHPSSIIRAQALLRLEELIVLEALGSQDGDPKTIVELSVHARLLQHAYPDKSWPQIQEHVLALVEKWLTANKIEAEATLSHIENGLNVQAELAQLEPPRP